MSKIIPSKTNTKPMSFSAALNMTLRGAKVCRQTWEDQEAYMAISGDGYLCICAPSITNDKTLHKLNLKITDIEAADWVIYELPPPPPSLKTDKPVKADEPKDPDDDEAPIEEEDF
jgi:hypothetical protein